MATQELSIPAPVSGSLTEDPRKIIKEAIDRSKQLQDIVRKTKASVKIGQGEHLKVEAWQTLGRFDSTFGSIEWTKPLLEDNKIVGYEARAVANRMTPDYRVLPISYAEAECRTTENNWNGKDLFSLKGMAQTRAVSRVLRNCFGWIAVLAGYEATPAEEMPKTEDKPTHGWRISKFSGTCSDCGQDFPTKKLLYDPSKKNKKKLCEDCHGVMLDQLTNPPQVDEEVPI